MTIQWHDIRATRPSARRDDKGGGPMMAPTGEHIMSKTGRRPGRPRIEKPHPVDVLVGRRVRLRRTLLGMSQEKLGDAIGLTFQQVQKYERGSNRIGSSRLWELSQVLDVPVGFFFEGHDGADGHAEAAPEAGDGGGAPSDRIADRETMELVRAFRRIRDAGVRRRIYDLIKAMAVADAVDA
jgi:transcriptional regulator with XRE-family HTH domain